LLAIVEPAVNDVDGLLVIVGSGLVIQDAVPVIDGRALAILSFLLVIVVKDEEFV
jgi:hypothetical protein